jgi:hypothetical protein
MFGNSRTPKKLYPITPKRRINRFITIARTGRLILVVEMLMMLLTNY